MKRCAAKAYPAGHNNQVNHIESATAALQGKYPHVIRQVVSFRGDTTLVVGANALLDVCRLLRHDPAMDYSFLVDLAAVDYHPHEPRFGVSYLLHALKHNVRLRLRVLLPGQGPRLPSVSGIWPAAEWMEREAFDLMGIEFAGHPDLRRILMPADWEGHPLRKDYVYEIHEEEW